MTLKEIKAMESKKIHEELSKAREKVRELRFGVVNRSVKNVREIRTLRRAIAQFLTILNQREKGIATKEVLEKKEEVTTK